MSGDAGGQPERPRGTPTIRSIDKAMAMLTALAGSRASLTVAELAERASVPKATAHRYAASLVNCGLVAQLEGSGYMLGFRLIELGEVARARFALGAACMPIMHRIADQTGETVMLVVPDWTTGEKVTLERVDTHHALSTPLPVGRRTPVRSGLFGKAMLMGIPPDQIAEMLRQLSEAGGSDAPPRQDKRLMAELDEMRALGYAVEQDDLHPGVSGVAVPVAIQSGRPLGSVGIVGPSSRIDRRISELGEILLEQTAPLRASARP